MTPQPPCMDEREWEAWLRAAKDASLKFVSPCSDCTPTFARAMRAEGRCDRPWAERLHAETVQEGER